MEPIRDSALNSLQICVISGGSNQQCLIDQSESGQVEKSLCSDLSISLNEEFIRVELRIILTQMTLVGAQLLLNKFSALHSAS
ncbi:MAG: hypothetical protein MHMPM18_000289 [Marteilia pararefringens]